MVLNLLLTLYVCFVLMLSAPNPNILLYIETLKEPESDSVLDYYSGDSLFIFEEYWTLLVE